MSYDLCWNHVAADGEVLEKFRGMACFSHITNKAFNIDKRTKYIEYCFDNKNVTDEEARKFFLFLKRIPHLKHLMPRAITPCIKAKKIRVDITKHNGTQVFTILTLLRMVRENPLGVKKILEFNPKKKYDWTPWGILKVCATAYTENWNHSILPGIVKKNINKVCRTETYWNEKEPAAKTGLRTRIFDTFQFAEDTYMSSWNGEELRRDIDKQIKGDTVEDIKRRPANRSRNSASTAHLQVPF